MTLYVKTGKWKTEKNGGKKKVFHYTFATNLNVDTSEKKKKHLTICNRSTDGTHERRHQDHELLQPLVRR